jgi:hypothetical protein
MGDVIEFPREIKVELEDSEDGQTMLEIGIVALWEAIGGFDLKEKLDHQQYMFMFLQYSGVCFDCMEKELIVVDEDGNLGIEVSIREMLENAIVDVERELTTKH